MYDDVELELWVLQPATDLGVGDGVRSPYRFQVILKTNRPQADADDPFVSSIVTLDLARLQALEGDWRAYGKALSDALFQDDKLRAAYSTAAATADAPGKPLRVRLSLGAGMSPLAALRWETLAEPQLPGRERGWLTLGAWRPFSRYLPLASRVRPPSRGPALRRALLVAASPTGLAGRFTPLDVPAEIARARRSLATFTCDTLPAEPAQGPPVTLAQIFERLRRGYEILYLICHGAYLFVEGQSQPQPVLLLANAAGQMEEVPFTQVVEGVRNLMYRPSLVVLASCESSARDGAGVSADDEGVFSALGPRLVTEAGVPAVLAMNGKVTIATATAFTEAFFKDLSAAGRGHGRIDQAASAARAVVAGRDDCWRPVLFSGLRSSALWSASAHDDGFKRWATLEQQAGEEKGALILGPGVGASLLTPTQPLAGFDAPEADADPPTAAQRILIRESPEVLRSHYLRQHIAALVARCRPCVDMPGAAECADPWPLIEAPASSPVAAAEALLKLCGKDSPMRPGDADRPWLQIPYKYQARLASVLHAAIGERLLPEQPYYALARMPVAFYVTVNHDGLLEAALRAAGREPVTRVFRWSEEIDRGSHDIKDKYIRWEYFQQQLDEELSYQRPLVYHLFGSIEAAEWLVLAEDDYFQYMMSAANLKSITQDTSQNAPDLFGIPSALEVVLNKQQLIFLGFQMSDWPFRATLRSILTQARVAERCAHKYISVAVQVAPEEGERLPGQIKRYLNGYFGQVSVETFWGEIEGFLHILRERKILR